MEPIYTVEEVAEKLKLTTFRVRALLREGRLKGFRLGKYWRVKETALEQLINSLSEEGEKGE